MIIQRINFNIEIYIVHQNRYSGYIARSTAAPTRKEMAAEFRLSCAIFLATTTVYIRTCSPTVTGGDNGELITAAYVLGVAHPPGYPLWTMLAALVIRFLEFTHSDVAYRVNLMSTVFGGIAATMLFRGLVIWFDSCDENSERDSKSQPDKCNTPPTSCTIERNLVFAAVGSLMFAFNPRVWHSSTHGEVMHLSNFLLSNAPF